MPEKGARSRRRNEVNWGFEHEQPGSHAVMLLPRWTCCASLRVTSTIVCSPPRVFELLRLMRQSTAQAYLSPYWSFLGVRLRSRRFSSLCAPPAASAVAGARRGMPCPPTVRDFNRCARLILARGAATSI